MAQLQIYASLSRYGSVTVDEVFVEPGERVEAGDLIYFVDTSQGSYEVQTPVAGTVQRVLSVGSGLRQGQPGLVLEVKAGLSSADVELIFESLLPQAPYEEELVAEIEEPTELHNVQENGSEAPKFSAIGLILSSIVISSAMAYAVSYLYGKDGSSMWWAFAAMLVVLAVITEKNHLLTKAVFTLLFVACYLGNPLLQLEAYLPASMQLVSNQQPEVEVAKAEEPMSEARKQEIRKILKKINQPSQPQPPSSLPAPEGNMRSVEQTPEAKTESVASKLNWGDQEDELEPKVDWEAQERQRIEDKEAREELLAMIDSFDFERLCQSPKLPPMDIPDHRWNKEQKKFQKRVAKFERCMNNQGREDLEGLIELVEALGGKARVNGNTTTFIPPKVCRCDYRFARLGEQINDRHRERNAEGQSFRRQLKKRVDALENQEIWNEVHRTTSNLNLR